MESSNQNNDPDDPPDLSEDISASVEVEKSLDLDLTQPKLVAETTFGSTFTRGCKWSPDGLCILLCNDDHSLRIFDYDTHLNEAVKVQEGEALYDFQWYPLMDSSKPEVCCFATTSQDHPIHLYDAFDGHIRASYRCFDHLDELVAARSLAFNPSGTKLLAGLKNQIRIFDVSVPGRDCDTIKTFDKKEGGQAGIISCITFNPAMEQVYALGSYSRSLGVYLMDERSQLLCILEGQKGGLTHLKFTPDGTKLIAGGRKDNDLLVWDMRQPGELYAVLNRTVETNQRIYFDVDSKGKYVMTGNTNGSVTAWDLASTRTLTPNVEDKVIPPVTEIKNLHQDAINGCSIHPWLPMISTCSGQRHIQCPMLIDKGDEKRDDNEENKIEEEKEDIKIENSLKVWSFQAINV